MPPFAGCIQNASGLHARNGFSALQGKRGRLMLPPRINGEQFNAYLGNKPLVGGLVLRPGAAYSSAFS